MMRNEILKKKESDFANDLLSFTNSISAPFLDTNPFQNIILAGNNPNSAKSQKKQVKKLSDVCKLSLKTLKNISSWQNQKQNTIQPLTTLLSIKKEISQNKKSIITSSSPNNLKNSFKIYEMFKIDEFLNSKKSQQLSQSDISCIDDNQQIDHKCDTQTAPVSDFIKYTLTDKCGSQSSRSYSKNNYSSPKGIFTSCVTEIKNVASLRPTINKPIDLQKSTPVEQFIQTQRRLTPQHKISSSFQANPTMKSSEQLLNSAKRQTQNFQVNSYKHSTASQQTPNNQNIFTYDLYKAKHCPNPSLITDLLDIEKNQDSKITKNYNQSIKVQTEIENKRKMSFPGGNITQEKKEEEQKQLYMKKVLDQNYQEGMSGRKPSKEKQQKLSITNPIFTEVDKSSLMDRSQIYILHQLQLKHQQKSKFPNKKPRIQSAQPLLNSKKPSQSNAIASSSFFGNPKEPVSDSQTQLKEPEIQSTQNIFHYHFQGELGGGNSKSTQNHYQLNQSQDILKRAQQLTTNQIKSRIHPELQSFNGLQKRSSKELISQMNLTSSQTILKTTINSKQNYSKKNQNTINNSYKNRPTGSKAIQMQKSQSFDEEKNKKEAESNLSIYKYSSNYYRPQTAQVQTKNTSAKKQNNKKSFNSLKSWENNDEDQSVCI